LKAALGCAISIKASEQTILKKKKRKRKKEKKE